MTSSRVTRLGASVLLSLMFTAGLTSSALGVSPTDPVPSPTADVPAKPNTQGAAPATTAPLVAIMGTVTGTGGTPLGNIQVQANSNGGSSFWAEETTAANGLYRVLVPTGTYTLMFVDPTGAYLSGYYSSGGFTTAPGSASTITVGTSDVTGINLQLGTGHFIRGTVTTIVGGFQFASLKVTANGAGYTVYTHAASNGTYALDVPAGAYTISFTDASGTYLNGYYSTGGFSGNFTTVPGSATAITVGTSDVTGINVTLQRNWFIIGTVTGPGGTPLSNIEVDTGNPFGGTTTRVDGTYMLQVASGTFTVRFSDYSGNYATGYYSSGGFTPLPGSATAITVGTSNVTGINVQMTAAVSPPPNVTVSLTPSSMVAPAGSVVAFIAVASQDVSPTTYWIVILDGNGTVVAVCGYTQMCTATVWSGAPAVARYHAVISQIDGTLVHASSAVLTVMWGGATYHPVTPTRVLDTRNGTGGLSGPFTNHVARTFTVAGVPAGATAVTGNLTVTGQTSSGYLFIGPVANNNPTSSTLNFPVGDDRANAVTVGLGAGGTLSITFVAPSNGPSAQAIFDLTGYFTSDVTGATYHALYPTRVLDTRNGTGGLAGPFTNHAARTFTATGVSSGVPPDAIAVTGNLTVTGQTSSGYLFIGPIATNDPGSSTLNFPVGDDRANAVTVALGTGGTLSITFVAPSNGPTAQAIFDVTGYFMPNMAGAIYVPLAPTRVLDSRNGTGGMSGPFTNHAPRTFIAAGVPANAIAATGNLTVTGQTSSGFLYIGPAAADNPTSSTLNFPVNDDRANAVTVAVNPGGILGVTFVAPSNGPTAHAIFDLTGYFVP